MENVTLAEEVKRCLIFFELTFGENEGFICIGFKARGIEDFKETYFKYPDDLRLMAEYCLEIAPMGDVYFCTQLLSKKRRIKENVSICPNLWVDLDYCAPSNLDVEPSVVIESSPGRYQGLWFMKPALEPAIAEDYSKRITYKYAEHGSDKNGWCLTKYLRVPYTYNYKYDESNGFVPLVRILTINPIYYDLNDFAHYPEAADLVQTAFPFPQELPGTASDVMMAKREDLHPMIWHLFMTQPPEGKWSGELWKLEVLLAEAGFNKEEIFCIAREAACNKYRRDDRPETELWKDVCKAWVSKFDDPEDPVQEHIELTIIKNELLTDEERLWVKGTPSIVEDYVEWAGTLTDASWQYHEAAILVILSSILCGSVRVPTSAVMLNTNLWFMLLANTTLTRKSSAMGIAMNVLDELDPEALLATDGSLEGLLTALSARPGRPSLFLRDEVSGLLDAMRKEYMAGLAEGLAKLYDGTRDKRILRKEIIDIRDPRLVFFSGGVKNRVYELLDSSHVMSGFLPRFIFITAEPIIKNLRPMGPPTVVSQVQRTKIIQRLTEIQNHYVDQKVSISVNGSQVGTQKKIWEAHLNDEAWHRFNLYTEKMLDEALKSVYRDMLVPTFDRLSKSGLKVAALLAATRNLGDSITIEVEDIIRAFYYVERWRFHAAEVIENLGKNPMEKLIDKIEGAIRREPGVSKSKIMRMHQLTAKSAEDVLQTMLMRGMIKRETVGVKGKHEKLFIAQHGDD